jgi:acid phosphatase
LIQQPFRLFVFAFTDWAVVAGAHLYPGQTYVGGTTTPATVNGDNGDSSYDIYNTNTIVDLLESAGLDYKVYSENYPTSGQCFFGSSYGNETATDVANFNPNAIGTNPINRAYERKHNPLISFKTFTTSPKRCALQKDFNDLTNDLANGNLPAFSFVVPNQAHDGHDTTVSYSGTWFRGFIANFTSSPVSQQSRVLIHTPYDEDDTAYTYYYNDKLDNAGNPNPYYNASCVATSTSPPNFCAPAGCTDLLDCTLDKNNNKVYSVLLGNAVPNNLVGTADNNYYTHYSVPATLEANWGLGTMGRGDVGAPLFGLTQATVNTNPVPTGKWFDKFVFIVLENQDIANILSDPNFKAIADSGLLHTNYHAVAHPSQPNCK